MKKILIIGESCKDIFVYCNANRLAPDLPIPVLSVIEKKRKSWYGEKCRTQCEKYYG